MLLTMNILSTRWNYLIKNVKTVSDALQYHQKQIAVNDFVV